MLATFNPTEMNLLKALDVANKYISDVAQPVSETVTQPVQTPVVPEPTPAIAQPVAQTGARYESPKELFLKKANKAYKDLEDNGLKGFAKRANDVVQDVASNIVSLEDAEKRLNGIIYESENPLVSGEWRDLGDRKVYFWEDMRYGEIVDTRKTEGRSKNVSNPWRTGDGKRFESLSVAKQHELETTSKYMFINDGYMQKTKSSETQQPAIESPTPNPDRDYLQSIIDGEDTGLAPKEITAKMRTIIIAAREAKDTETMALGDLAAKAYAAQTKAKAVAKLAEVQ
jgi:hypothetical protein